MPEMHFRVRWPDGSTQRCYSPSLVIKDHLRAGESYALDEFLARSRRALHSASERVREKYGFACTSAAAEMITIEAAGARFAALAGARVTMEAYEE